MIFRAKRICDKKTIFVINAGQTAAFHIDDTFKYNLFIRPVDFPYCF